MQYLSGMAIEPEAAKMWLNVMLKRAMVLNYDPTCFHSHPTGFEKKLEHFV
jgi:hypothetical protein